MSILNHVHIQHKSKLHSASLQLQLESKQKWCPGRRAWQTADLLLPLPYCRAVVSAFTGCCDWEDSWLPGHAHTAEPSSPCLLSSCKSPPAAQLSSCKHLIRLMHSAQAENSIYHSYSNEFPLRWQIQPHHVRKSSQPLACTEHTHFTCTKPGLCVVSFPLSCSAKKCHSTKVEIWCLCADTHTAGTQARSALASMGDHNASENIIYIYHNILDIIKFFIIQLHLFLLP